jgi:predicted lysophospholipase L1 biosynthesis ABC-type transport system permease subunit
VAIVSADLTRRLWPGESPIGKRISRHRGTGEKWPTVVGVAGETRDGGMEKPPVPHVYEPWAQNRWWPGAARLIVRTSIDPLALAPSLRQAILQQDPRANVMGLYRLGDVVRESAWRLNDATILACALGIVALLLSLMGVYGVLSQLVHERTREIGLRIALGARGRNVVSLVLTHVLATVCFGIVAGLALAAGMTQFLRHLLFGIDPLDPMAFAGAALVLCVTASVASALPALRAVRTSPIGALRHE